MNTLKYVPALIILIAILAIIGCGQGEGMPGEIQINIIVNMVFPLIVIISGVVAIIFHVKPKRYYGELNAVVFTLILFLFMLRMFLSNSFSPLLAISGLIIMGLAIIATSVRLVRKINKGESDI